MYWVYSKFWGYHSEQGGWSHVTMMFIFSGASGGVEKVEEGMQGQVGWQYKDKQVNKWTNKTMLGRKKCYEKN